MHLLIVDDHPTNRKLLRAQLETEGHAVTEAADGMEALAALDRGPVDAVISDILMPRMDGYRLCYELRRRESGATLPFLFYTATYTNEADARLARDLGADDFLRKPAPSSTLLQALAAAVRQPGPRPSPPGEATKDVLKEYSERLVAKLEAKNLELTATNAALAASEARFASAFRNSPVALLLARLDGGAIVDVNAAWSQLTGIPRAEALGRTSVELGYVDAATRARLADLLARHGRFDAEVVAVRPRDGGQRTVLGWCEIIPDAGDPLAVATMLDMTEREEAARSLRIANDQLRALAARVVAVRDQERTAIAREIHDVLAQELTRLKIDLVGIEKWLGRPLDEEKRAALAARVADAKVQADTAISVVQRIATELRPVILDALGLPAAVEWQAEDFARRTGLACQARVPEDTPAVDRERGTALFRILQESLTNVARHAHATRVAVELTEEAEAIVLTVEDDGAGVTLEQLADPHSIGLVGMRERAVAFGGTLEISRRVGGGTRVCVRLPLEPAAPPSP